MPGVGGERRLPAEDIAVEGRRPLDVPDVEHQVPELLDLHGIRPFPASSRCPIDTVIDPQPPDAAAGCPIPARRRDPDVTPARPGGGAPR